MTQRRSILTVLGKAPPPPKPMVRIKALPRGSSTEDTRGAPQLGTTPIGGPWTVKSI
jgi:hypothetical protein